MNMLWGFIFKDNEWVGGQIYDPDSGTTYKCKMWLLSADKLNVKGYVGISPVRQVGGLDQGQVST